MQHNHHNEAANYSKRNAARIRIFLIGSLIVVVMLYTLIEKYSFSLSDFIQQLWYDGIN